MLKPRFQGSTERMWLLLWVIWIAAFTFVPFETSFSLNELPSRIEDMMEVGESFALSKLVAHFASFFILGVLIAVVYSSVGPKRLLIRIMVLGLVGCILLEGLQLFQLGRHARIGDIAINYAGMITGCTAAIFFASAARMSPILRFFLVRHYYFAAGFLGLAVVLWWCMALRPAFGGLQLNWDTAYPLAIGNEIGGARPWGGHMRYAGVYGRALSSRQAMRLFDDLTTPDVSRIRTDSGLLAGYDFRHPSMTELEPAGLLYLPALTLTIPPEMHWSSGDGITLIRPTILRSRQAAASLTEKIVSSGAFSVEVWASPESLIQVGPARLITVSLGTGSRNFTLGQSGRDLVFRVRNSLTGLNGNIHELEARGVIESRYQHLLAVYDHGVSTVYKDGRRVATVDLREPVYYWHISAGVFGKAAFYALAIITISLPALALCSSLLKAAMTHFVTILFTLLMCVSPYFISCLFIHGPWRFGFFAWILAGLLLVYPVSAFYTTRGSVAQAR